MENNREYTLSVSWRDAGTQSCYIRTCPLWARVTACRLLESSINYGLYSLACYVRGWEWKGEMNSKTHCKQLPLWLKAGTFAAGALDHHLRAVLLHLPRRHLILHWIPMRNVNYIRTNNDHTSKWNSKMYIFWSGKEENFWISRNTMPLILYRICTHLSHWIVKVDF